MVAMTKIENKRGTALSWLIISCLIVQVSAFSGPKSFLHRPNLLAAHGHSRGLQPLYSALEDRVLSQEEETDEATFMRRARPKNSRLRNFIWKNSSFPRKAIRIYSDYARQLWYETSTDARKNIAQDKAAAAIRAVENLIKEEEYVEFSEETTHARQNLLDACHVMLAEMKTAREAAKAKLPMVIKIDEENKPVEPKKNRRSIMFGATMGFAVACWVFSGNYLFTGVFTLMTILGQLEYYRMIMNTGIYPARKISVVGASSMFLTVSPCVWSNGLFSLLVVSPELYCLRRLCLLRTCIKFAFLSLACGQ
jgi:hypothetical protein